MASDFNAGGVDECPELYGDLDGCMKDGVRLPASYGDTKMLGFDPLKGRSVGVELGRFSTNLGKGIPVVSNGWKHSKSLDCETGEWWNEDDVDEDWKLFEQSPYDYMPSLIGGEHKQSCLAGFGNDGRHLTPGRTEQVLPLMPCSSGTSSNFSNKQAIAQNGSGFYLPSDRTIFDLDIEAFEKKPWRHQGVDKTDFFNFGFDEESWKNYHDSVQVKAYENLPTNSMVGEVNCFDPGEKNPVVLNYLEKVGIEFDLPKGRAIPVEIGVGERIPSSYLRSVRRYDPDVVIQISLVDNGEENVKETFPSVDEKQENAEGRRPIEDLAMISENDVYNCLFSVEHEGQRSGEFTKSVEHNHHKVETNVSMILAFNDVDGNDKNPGRQEEGMAHAESSFGNEVFNSPSSHDLENHCEASEDSFPHLNVPYTPKRVSLNSDSGPQESNMPECNLSNMYARNTCKTMVEDVAHDRIVHLRGGKQDSEKKTQSDAELYVLASDDQNHKLAGKMHQTPDVMSFSKEKDDCSWMKKSMEDEHHFFLERGRHNTDTSSLRERPPDSWTSGEKDIGHSRLRSIVEIPSKNRGDGSITQRDIDCHQSSYIKGCRPSYAKYRDYDNNDLSIEDSSIYTKKTVYGEMKRLNHPKALRYCAENNVNIRRCKRLPHDQFSSGWNTKYGIYQVDKKSPHRQKLFDDHLLSNARKELLAEGFEEIDSRGYPAVSQCILGSEWPEKMAFGRKKGVSISFNGWEGKVSKKTDSLGNRSIWERLGDDYATDRETKDLMHVKQEVDSHPTYKVKGNSHHLTRSKRRRMRRRKSFHSSYATRMLPEKCPVSKGNEDDEMVEGELTEKPGCKEPASRKKKKLPDNADAQPNFAAHQSDYVPEEKMCSKDVQQKNMLAEDHDSKCILETMAKMARRRERFKESLLPKQENLKTQNPLVDSTTVMNEIMELRPTRKRLWRTVS